MPAKIQRPGPDLANLPDADASLDPGIVDLGPDFEPADAAVPRNDQPILPDAAGLVEPGEDPITGNLAGSKTLSPGNNPFGLSQKELRFAYCYAITGNLAEAVRFAGYKGGSSQGVKLMQRDDIRAHVQTLSAQAREVQKAEPPASGEEVLARFWEIGNACIADAYILRDGKMQLKPFEAMPLGLKRAIKKINFDKEGRPVSIELHDSLSALGRLAGYMGLRMNPGGGPWDAGGISDPGGQGDIPDNLPATTEPGRVRKTLTFEERMAANGDRVRKRVLQIDG